MSEPRPPSRVILKWTGNGLHFEGGAPDRPQGGVDGDSVNAPSPVDTLLMSLAGCMGADVVEILAKSRVPIEGLEVVVEAERAETPPRRLTRVSLAFRVEGMDPSQRSKVERAVDLSRTTYCSVMHSLRPDLDLHDRIEYAEGPLAVQAD